MDFLRGARNRREFKRNGVYGKKLTFRFTSHCRAANKGDVVIGDGCEIKGSLRSFEGGKIKIGNNLFVNFRSYVGATDSVEIGDDGVVATDARIFDNNNHPTSPAERRRLSRCGNFYGDLRSWRRAVRAPVVIGDNAWIGEFAAVLKGVTIGKGASVASRSVVAKDAPERAVVAGNPAGGAKYLEEGDLNEA